MLFFKFQGLYNPLISVPLFPTYKLRINKIKEGIVNPYDTRGCMVQPSPQCIVTPMYAQCSHVAAVLSPRSAHIAYTPKVPPHPRGCILRTNKNFGNMRDLRCLIAILPFIGCINHTGYILVYKFCSQFKLIALITSQIQHVFAIHFDRYSG